MTVEEMKRIKEEMGYSLKTLSGLTGVPAVTLQKVFSGETKSPRQETLEALQRVLSPKSKTEYTYPKAAADAAVLAESAYTYGTSAEKTTVEKKQGEYTIEDYYAIPDDRRVELIDGVIYDMAAPTTVHQDIVFYIHMCIYDHIRSKKKKCKVYESPIDVQIDCDDKTMLQPDVLVVCERDKIELKKIYGAPDFILEVLSPSTRKKDMSIKLAKYIEAKVREYWIIDPKKKVLIKYNFMDEDYIPEVYSLEESVPLSIAEEELVIDLHPVKEAIEEFE